MRLYFGSPGSGKTTVAVKMAKKCHRRYKYIYTTFPTTLPFARCRDLHGVGQWAFPEGSLVLADEAGVDFNSRAYKTMQQYTIRYFKKHRHYINDWVLFSQSWEDTDVTLRRLTDELWYVYRIGPWSLCRRVYKRVTVDDVSHQIVDGYKMASVLWLLVWPFQLGWPFAPKWSLTFRPFYYRYFDSYEKDNDVKIVP